MDEIFANRDCKIAQVRKLKIVSSDTEKLTASGLIFTRSQLTFGESEHVCSGTVSC